MKVVKVVPQGLSWVLFCCYSILMTLLIFVETPLPVLYADDTNLFISGTKSPQIEEMLNMKLWEISHWMTVNKLSLNIIYDNSWIDWIAKSLDTKSKNVLGHSFIASKPRYCPNLRYFCVLIDSKKKIRERCAFCLMITNQISMIWKMMHALYWSINILRMIFLLHLEYVWSTYENFKDHFVWFKMKLVIG